MLPSLLVFLMAKPISFKSFCEKHLVAKDPYPYAEVETSVLFEAHFRRPDFEIDKELMFRFRSGMMSDVEKAFYLERFRDAAE